MANKRKNIRAEDQKEVIVRSRRRCSICFGLNRDKEVKMGQIAHIDHDPGNNDVDNLVWLCLNHHCEYDSRTSQSKGFTVKEIIQYRKELYEHYDEWSSHLPDRSMLRFMASRITYGNLAEAAIEAASEVYAYGDQLAYAALTTTRFESEDSDRWFPMLYALERYEYWGWLEIDYKEYMEGDRIDRVDIRITQKTICSRIAEVIRDKIEKRGKVIGI